ncbi:MAG TPA: hypothetical protein VJ553_02105 [Candidatus Paceibacterota bacterium]|nr:hypothetical protein [Candidatus Paceibacterota bacterium]
MDTAKGYGPTTHTMRFDGADDPAAGIVVKYVSWGGMWLWEIMSWSEVTQRYQDVINNGATLHVSYRTLLED